MGHPLFLVRVKGLEPSQPCGHKNLNLARLPIPPNPRQAKRMAHVLARTLIIIAHPRGFVKNFFQKTFPESEKERFSPIII